MTRRNRHLRRPLQLRLLSTLPALFALAALIAGGTALADGPLSLPPAVTEAADQTVAPVSEPLAPVTRPVTDAVEQTVAPVAKPVTDAVDQTVAPVAEPVTKPVTDVVDQTVAPVAEPVTKPVTDVVDQTVAPVTKPVTAAVKQTTSSVTKPVTGAVAQTTAAASKPVADAVTQTRAAVKPAAAVVKPVVATTKPITHAAKRRVAVVEQRVQGTVRSTGDSLRSTAGSSAGSQSPAGTGGVAETVRSTAGVVVAGGRVLAPSAGGRVRDVVAGESSAIAQGGDDAFPSAILSPPRWAAEPAAQRGTGSAPGAGSGTIAAARPQGDGPSRAGMIGLAALLGALGLGALRSGQVASGLAALGGTGGLRSATQFAVLSRWSGQCAPVGGDVSANASFARSTERALAASTGGRGDVKGAVSAAVPPGARGGPAPVVALVDPPALPRGSESPPAVLWGVLLAASAAIGAVLGQVTGKKRSESADDPA